jgi:dTDP-4-dehydrorhamnose reductase
MLTGANGLVGQYLTRALLTNHHTVMATGRGAGRLSSEGAGSIVYRELDIQDGPAIHETVASFRPEVIIHGAAITQADDCETHQVACWTTNVTATRFLLDAAGSVGARFIYLSTDFVFDGLSGPYREADTTSPVNYYGCTKRAAEKAVMQYKGSWAIVRTVLVYGKTRKGSRITLVGWVKDMVGKGEQIRVVNDQVRTPTYAADLALALVRIAERDAQGIFHISGAETFTPYQMALVVAEYLHLDQSLIIPVDASTFTQPAARPPKTGFIIQKAIRDLDFHPTSFREGLALVFDGKEDI